jgi:DNA repair exonuclease SbcCD ATPase subunit
MMDRMKKDYISSKLSTTDLDLSLKSKTQLVTDQLQRQRMTKEEKLQSKSIFDQLMKNIEKEQKDRQDRIIELQKCIKNKEESVQRRIERQKRNQDIAEAAANENKDATEMKMRD